MEVDKIVYKLIVRKNDLLKKAYNKKTVIDNWTVLPCQGSNLSRWDDPESGNLPVYLKRKNPKKTWGFCS
jgi:hypothetical protein